MEDEGEFSEVGRPPGAALFGFIIIVVSACAVAMLFGLFFP